MDYMTIGLVALIALAVVLLVLWVLGNGYADPVKKFLGLGV